MGYQTVVCVSLAHTRRDLKALPHYKWEPMDYKIENQFLYLNSNAFENQFLYLNSNALYIFKSKFWSFCAKMII
jgi:hypothetical protein